MTTLKEKIGQVFMVGLRAGELTKEEKQLLKNYPFGGFILFSHNLQEPKQVLSLCQSLWQGAKECPPFIAIDHEGGKVHRLPPPFTHFPPPAMLGRTGDPGLAYEVGLAMARELSSVGINLNFAPVLDVHSNPNNPIIGDRALGTHPEIVIRFAGPLIRGLRDGRVIPCGKHFPGHGDTAEDSHLELPVVEKDRKSLDTVELPPFVFACGSRIECLMTAHVLYPALDSTFPATLSEAIVGNLLREGLGYQGVVFTDDLEMKAISKNYPVREAVSRAVDAGVDVLLFCNNKENAVQDFDFLYQQAEKNAETKARIEVSYQRIKRLKQRYLQSFKGMGEDLLTEHIGITSHQKLAEEIIKAGED